MGNANPFPCPCKAARTSQGLHSDDQDQHRTNSGYGRNEYTTMSEAAPTLFTLSPDAKADDDRQLPDYLEPKLAWICEAMFREPDPPEHCLVLTDALGELLSICPSPGRDKAIWSLVGAIEDTLDRYGDGGRWWRA